MLWIGNGALHVRDLVKHKQVQRPCQSLAKNPNTVAFSLDRRLVAFGGDEGFIPVVDVTTGKEMCRFDKLPKGYEGLVHALDFSSDGRLLAWTMGAEGTVHIGEVATGREVHRLTGCGGAGYALSFSGDGKLLVAGAQDTTALLWDARTLRNADGPPSTK